MCPTDHIYRVGYTRKVNKKEVTVAGRCIPATSQSGKKTSEIDREAIETRASIHKQAREIFKKDIPKKCSKGKIIREGYFRSPYTRASGTQVKGVWVKPVCVPSINADGEGKKKQLFRLEPHVLSKYGYHNLHNLSDRQRHIALGKALKDGIKPLSLLRRVNALSVLHKNTDPELSGILKSDLDYIRSTKIYQNRSSKK